MQTVINYFNGLDKATIKQFTTVAGLIAFFVLTLVIMGLVSFGQMEAAANTLTALIAVGVVTLVVGWEYFSAV